MPAAARKEVKMKSRIVPFCRSFGSALLGLLCLAWATPSAHANGFDLGQAINYSLLFEGGGHNTLQITNVSTNVAGTGAGQGGGVGNIGVGNTGLATVSGPSTIDGSIDFSAANTGQFSSNNASNVINGASPGTANFNVAAVTSALNTVNALNTTLGGLPGANTSISGNTMINASAGMQSGNIEVFNVTSFSLNNGQTLTINGNGDLVVFNFTSSTNFHGNVALSGGLTPDQVVFNWVGGSNLTGGPTLDLNNGGGSPSNSSFLSQGIFLDPNGPINVTNSNVLGRIFGGDSHDFQFVSGSNITAPSSVPEPASLLLLGTGLCSIAALSRKHLLRK